MKPSSNGSNGRDNNGRFAKGNAGGPGNPYGKVVAQLRNTIIASIFNADVASIVSAVAERAKTGDVAAAKFILQTIIGSGPVSAHVEKEFELKVKFSDEADYYRRREPKSCPEGWVDYFALEKFENETPLTDDLDGNLVEQSLENESH